MGMKPWPTVVKDDEWDLVARYLALMGEDAPQREHDLREIDTRSVGSDASALPGAWAAVCRQVQRCTS